MKIVLFQRKGKTSQIADKMLNVKSFILKRFGSEGNDYHLDIKREIPEESLKKDVQQITIADMSKLGIDENGVMEIHAAFIEDASKTHQKSLFAPRLKQKRKSTKRKRS